MGTAVPGMPSWVDLGSPDLEASRHFYSRLFGWTAEVSLDPQFGGYTTFKKDGRPVAGAGSLTNESQAPAWSTYVATDNADAVAAKVEENGGTVVAQPMDVGQEGRMAVFADPAGAKRFYGAVFGWEAKDTPNGDTKYTLWRLDGQPVGGMMQLVGPADLPPLWMVYLAVEDCDATAEQASGLGGQVAVPPMNNVQGRFAVLTDPQGAVFSIIKAG